MKKIFFIAATAALALSSCSSDEQLVENVQSVEDGAVVFSANTLRNTRAYTKWGDPIADEADLIIAGGFGVFGYEHGEKNYATFSASSSAPNFFYNQQVTSNDAGANWKYSPVKYYSNNKGAQHSFFAYAPFNEDVNNVFALGSAPAIKYSSKENYDLMWAKPYVDMEKPGVNQKLLFNFKHALSKVDIEVAPFVDEVHPGANNHQLSQVLDENTTIVVRSVKFVGVLASEGLLSLEDGTWKYIATEESAYEINEPVILKKEGQTEGTSPEVQKYQPVTSNMMVIPTTVGEGVKIQIVYDVITKDDANSVNNSTVTNTITSKETFMLDAGKAYTFHLDLGMTSVKFNATVTDWEKTTPADTNVDLPNNTYAEPVALTDDLSEKTLEASAITVGTAATNYAVQEGKLGQYSAATPPVWTAVTSAIGKNYFDVNKNIYSVTSTEGDVTVYPNVDAFIANISSKKVNVWDTTSSKYVQKDYKEVDSIVPRSDGKLYKDGTALASQPVNGDYILCNGKLYKWVINP